MPLITPAPTFIEVDVSPRQRGDTLIRQRARFSSLLHTQDSFGASFAQIVLIVTMYAASGDGYGEPLSGKGFSQYQETLVANNETLVNAETGAILAIHQGEGVAEWQAIIDSFEGPTMLQGDFFQYLRENVPIKIGDMIRQHIAQADAMGKFA